MQCDEIEFLIYFTWNNWENRERKKNFISQLKMKLKLKTAIDFSLRIEIYYFKKTARQSAAVFFLFSGSWIANKSMLMV